MREIDEYNQLSQQKELELLIDKENGVYYRYFRVHLCCDDSGWDGYTTFVKINLEQLRDIPNIIQIESEENGFNWTDSLYTPEFKELLFHLQHSSEQIKKDLTQEDYVIDEIIEVSERFYINGGYYA